MENSGSVDIVNPWIVANQVRDWFSENTIVEEALQGETDPRRKAFRIWRFIRDKRYHANPAETGCEIHAPVRFFNVYGYGYCDDCAYNAERLFRAAGFDQVRSWGLDGHVVPEVFYNGAWRMLDPDLKVFYPLEDNETLAGVEALAANPELVKRVSGNDIAILYSTRQNNTLTRNNCPDGATMAMTLRPGERLERYWSNWGKYHDNYFKTPPPAFGNGRLVYEPPLRAAFSQKGFSVWNHLQRAEANSRAPAIHLASPEREGLLICTMRSPYVFVGGVLRMGIAASSASDTLTIEFSKPGLRQPVILDVITGPTSSTLEWTLDEHIAPLASPACYDFTILITMTGGASASVGIESFRLCGEIQCAPAALPALAPGQINEIEARMSAAPGAALRITQECDVRMFFSPPEVPRTIEPPNGDRISTSTPHLRWSASDTDSEISQYEILVSWDPEGILPVSPLLWRMVKGATEWRIPGGWLNENQTYYWMARAQDIHGQWSPWSAPSSFTIQPALTASTSRHLVH